VCGQVSVYVCIYICMEVHLVLGLTCDLNFAFTFILDGFKIMLYPVRLYI